VSHQPLTAADVHLTEIVDHIVTPLISQCGRRRSRSVTGEAKPPCAGSTIPCRWRPCRAQGALHADCPVRCPVIPGGWLSSQSGFG